MWRDVRSASLSACVVILLMLGVRDFGAEPDAQAPDTMKELLAEVRGLRAAMEQLASAGPRVQLMFGDAMSILARSTSEPSSNSPARIRANRSRFSVTGRSR